MRVKEGKAPHEFVIGDFACHVSGHYAGGMFGTVTVGH